jgi:hypothetical protein
MRDRITAALMALVLALSLAAPVAAGPLEDGKAAYDHGDYATVLRLWRPLADQGNADAQVNLGFMCTGGHGVPQDYTEALKWFRRAADQDNATAQFNLGVMYDKGQGVPQDYVQAHKWYNLAASGFSAASDGRGKDAAAARDAVAAKMTPAQIAEAQKLAREWKPNSESAK